MEAKSAALINYRIMYNVQYCATASTCSASEALCGLLTVQVQRHPRQKHRIAMNKGSGLVTLHYFLVGKCHDDNEESKTVKHQNLNALEVVQFSKLTKDAR